MLSDAPPWSKAITGLPIACASIITLPKGSGFRLGATTTSANIYAAGKSSKKGRKTIFPKTLYFFAKFLKLVT